MANQFREQEFEIWIDFKAMNTKTFKIEVSSKTNAKLYLQLFFQSKYLG